jgi:hypothetical protein
MHWTGWRAYRERTAERARPGDGRVLHSLGPLQESNRGRIPARLHAACAWRRHGAEHRAEHKTEHRAEHQARQQNKTKAKQNKTQAVGLGRRGGAVVELGSRAGVRLPADGGARQDVAGLPPDCERVRRPAASRPAARAGYLAPDAQPGSLCRAIQASHVSVSFPLGVCDGWRGSNRGR